MTVETEQDTASAPNPLGGVVAGTRGHVVFGAVPERLAIWHTTPAGEKTGAWIQDRDVDREQARRLLTLIERRAVAGLDRDDDLAVLARLGDIAEVPLPDAYAEHWLDLRLLLTEVATIRAELAAAVDEQQNTSSSRLQPLAYVYETDPAPLPRELPDALAACRVSQPRSEAEPAAREAIGKASLLAAAAARWADTESARLRRTYLTPLGGPAARPLPPTWLEHLIKVYDVTFDL